MNDKREVEYMKVSKILNNNLVLSRGENGQEVVVKGRGIGFHAKRGDLIDSELIEKIFIPENRQNSIQIQEYLMNLPEDILDFVQKYIDIIKEKYEMQLHNSLYLSLSDHLTGTIQRWKKGITLKNMLLLDIEQLYKKEYEIGKDMLQEINQTFQIELPIDEAGFIALHFLNAEEGQEEEDNYTIAVIVSRIREIVRNYYKEIVFDEESLYYQRFLTHLKFFAQRYLHKELHYSEDEKLYQIIREQYKEAYGCVKLIYFMMQEEYQYELTEEEMIYLTIHIQTNVEKSRKK